jgi:hypothetical protein
MLYLKKVLWGRFMAKIIRTGEVEAITLKHLHSRDILYLDDEIDTTLTGKHPNGGFARICMEVKNGILGLIEFIKTSKPENR